jgi:hypothetical protein
MKHFRYSIEGNEIKDYLGEVQSIPPDYIETKNSLGWERLYYRIRNGKISDIIGEAMREEGARQRVEEFISALNVGLV